LSECVNRANSTSNNRTVLLEDAKKIHFNALSVKTLPRAKDARPDIK
jgi:hypothetical protein